MAETLREKLRDLPDIPCSKCDKPNSLDCCLPDKALCDKEVDQILALGLVELDEDDAIWEVMKSEKNTE